MGKFAVVLLTQTLLILPIILGSRFHGHESYKQYYNNHVNGGLKPTTASYEMPKESYYNPNKDTSVDNGIHASEDRFGFSDVWQVRNGDNYAGVTHCDHRRQTYCEDVPDYPQKFVNQMLAANSSLLHYATEDFKESGLTPKIDDQETPLCLSMEKLIYPKTAENKDNVWLYILQSEEAKFSQGLRIEACSEENAKCEVIDGFAEGYITMCKQKYIYRELTAISETGEIIRDYFRLPASCCCHIEYRAGEGSARERSFSEDISPRFMRKTYV
ncbi:protein spaetzle-like isoform X2 [Temnothorax nylanderi]|uniref:protein spaetzle-like isoform X2 n=1 Tax=Temnothorax nylanderi TaxID=102681 RepID=UPI003A87B6A9